MNPTTTPEPSQPAGQTLGRPGTFALSGIINTAVDFLILNICVFLLGLALIPANFISTSVALGLSYLLNQRWVFKGSTHSRKTVVLFIGITLFGLFVLQNIVIYYLTGDRTIAAQGLHYIVSSLDPYNSVAIEANVAKVVATIVSAVWNYVMYKNYVFKKF